MAIVQFGSAADMRLENEYYGIAELHGLETFLEGFVPASQEVVQQTGTRVVVRVYDGAGDAITVTVQGNFSAGRATYFAVEAGGLLLEVRGNLLVDALGNVSGRLDRWDVLRTADGSVVFDVSGIDISFNSSGTLPDFSDAAVFSGADVMTGSAGNDYLLGYGGADTLYGGGGNDTLDGGNGANVLSGGAGDDVYRVDNALGQAVENPGNGSDTVRSTVTYQLGAHVDHLSLRGTENIDGTGNAGGNVLTGNTASNLLAGLAGADTLEGGRSPDKLLGGIGADLLIGGLGPDRLAGGADADTLAGGAGRDALTGGRGADVFDFDTALNTNTNVDRIIGFSVAEDLIRLDADVFSAIAPGALDAAAFQSGPGVTMAQEADDRICYNSTNGKLFYDGDGTGGAAATLFAVLDGAPGIAAANLFIVA